MIEFIKMREAHLEQVLTWRTDEFVTRYMYTDIAFDLAAQRDWFQKVESSASDKYWIVLIKGAPVGVISLNGIDAFHHRTSWGYYIGDEHYRMYGGIIPPYLYNYAFFRLGMNKITAEVMEGNDNVLKIHRLHGYRDVGLFKNHIRKYDKYYDVYLMELLKEDWVRVAGKYKKYVAEFES